MLKSFKEKIKYGVCEKGNNNKNELYRCVNCGYSIKELFHTYSPTVQKLTECKNCNSISDPIIEFDNLYIIINLILLSSHAQRHVLYNTSCKSLYKILMIVTIIESYFLWNELSENTKKTYSYVNNDVLKDPLFMEKGFYLSTIQIVLCKLIINLLHIKFILILCL